MPTRAPAARRRALPALFLSVPVAAFAGLTVLSTAPAPGNGFDQLVVAEPAPTPPALELLGLPQPVPTPTTAATQPPAPKPAPSKAAAKPRPKATATPTPRRTAESRPQRASRSGTGRTSGTAAPRATATRSSADSSRSSSSGSSRAAVCPVDGPHSFTDTWGAARSGGRRHQGTDMMASHGTRLVATVSGTVRTASSSAGGISLYLRGDNGDTYFYAHNARNVVSSGQRVQAGQLVGYVGSSGNADSSAPHLHFERHPGGGGAVNPYPYLRSVCG